MGLNGKLEAVVEAKSSSESLFKLLAAELHNIPDASSDNVHGVEVHEGDWVSTGSIKLWTYTIDGQKEVFKEKVEIDEESRTMTMEAVGGHILDKYKACKIIYQVLPNGGSSKVKVEIVYESSMSSRTPMRTSSESKVDKLGFIVVVIVRHESIRIRPVKMMMWLI